MKSRVMKSREIADYESAKGRNVYRIIVSALLLLASLAVAAALNGQDVHKASPEELAAITERGRLLAEYDQAAWHATDAVQTANPKTVEGQHYLGKKESGKWTIVFGSLSAGKNKFMIRYEAAQQENPKEFAIKQDEPAKEDDGFFLFAARALELALADFGPAARPYNVAVLPAKSGNALDPEGLFVYLYPGQIKAGVYPLGGDARYLISSDGKRILAKRQMHKSVIENRPPKGKKVEAGFHTHVLSDVPEDSDVLHVLQQSPPVPEFVSTQHFLYEIASDGTIRTTKIKK